MHACGSAPKGSTQRHLRKQHSPTCMMPRLQRKQHYAQIEQVAIESYRTWPPSHSPSKEQREHAEYALWLCNCATFSIIMMSPSTHGSRGQCGKVALPTGSSNGQLPARPAPHSHSTHWHIRQLYSVKHLLQHSNPQWARALWQ